MILARRVSVTCSDECCILCGSRPTLGLLGWRGTPGCEMLSAVTRGTSRPDPPRFETGDRVIAAHHIGGVFRPRVPHGTVGIVIELIAQGRLVVHFAGEHREVVDVEDITFTER